MTTTEKSHVGMGHKLCPVCGTKHDEVVLLDRRLRKSLDRDVCMGFELCPEHAKMSGEYLSIVEAVGNPLDGGTLTGRSAHLRWHIAGRVFDVEMSRLHPFVFCEPGVIERLQAMQPTNH